MTQSSGQDAFRETRWSLVVQARDSREHLEELLRLYWPPVFSYVRARGRSVHDAADITQAFLTHVLLGRDLVEAADPERGRFRAFLKTALQRFLIDEHRREHGRSGERAVTFLPNLEALAEAVSGNESKDPTEAFDRQWATTVLNTALERVEEDMRRRGRETDWNAFDLRVLSPVKRGDSPPSLEQISAAVGEADKARLSRMIHGVRQALRLAMRDVVAETVTSADEIEPELHDVMAALGLA